MNNKLTSVLISLIALAITIQTASANPSRTLAQIRGEDSQEFFGEGDEQMDREIQTLEDGQPQAPSLEQEERNLEQDLNIQQNNPDAPKIEDIPSPALGDGDNVPTPPPLGEAEIKFPE